MKTLAILLLALSALSALLCLAQAQEVPSDDAHRVLASCGKPLKDRTKPLPALPSASERVLTYKGIELRFARFPHFPENGFRFLAYKRDGAVGIERTVAASYLPCMTVAWPADSPAATKVEVKKATPPAPDPWAPSPAVIIIGAVVFLIFGAVVALAQYGNNRLWRNRPSRLCIACNSVRQPGQHKGGHFFCPVCQADHPIPLDSPAARERLARK